MTKEKIPEYLGWYRPHQSYDWTGLIADPKTGELVKEESMTKQSFKEECDVNNILKQYTPQAVFEALSQQASRGVYADLPSGFEFQDAMNLVVEGRQAFDALPSQVRERFMNDPARFLAFMSDPANVEDAIKLGLAVRQPEPPPPEIPLSEQIAAGVAKGLKPPSQSNGG